MEPVTTYSFIAIGTVKDALLWLGLKMSWLDLMTNKYVVGMAGVTVGAIVGYYAMRRYQEAKVMLLDVGST